VFNRVEIILILLLLCFLMQIPPVAAADRDPLQPAVGWRTIVKPAGEVKPEKELKLSSLLISDSRRVAVINGRSCKTGDTIDGAVVKTISENSVLLFVNGKNRKLQLSVTGMSKKPSSK